VRLIKSNVCISTLCFCGVAILAFELRLTNLYSFLVFYNVDTYNYYISPFYSPPPNIILKSLISSPNLPVPQTPKTPEDIKTKMSFTLVIWTEEWAKKMIAVGLMPSTTGKPGGKIVGQVMSDYPIENGVFLKALDKMPDRLKLPFISTEAEARYMVMISGDSSPTATADPSPPKKNKVKYTCPSCQTNVWGKTDLNLICGDCGDCGVGFTIEQ